MATITGTLRLSVSTPFILSSADFIAPPDPQHTDTSNAFDGLSLDGFGTAIIERPVVPAPYPYNPGVVDKAIAFAAPTLVKGRPADDDWANMRAVFTDAGVPRILIDNQDVTWWEADAPGDEPLEVPGYTLTEPFGYGASEPLTIKRTNCMFQTCGTGALSWLHKGATVKYQRVYGSTVVTDYVGFITSINTSGREFVVDIAGAVSGRANLQDRQTTLIRHVHDIGNLVGFVMEGLGFRLSPRLPDVGVDIVEAGNMTTLSYLQSLCALSRTANTEQWAIMPNPWGSVKFTFAEKDVETVDLTVFADGKRVVLNLVDDLTEQPNTVFGSGVSLKGERWRGARYPGFFQGPPADYPYSDTSTTFGVGTTDADTDTGDGITVLAHKLAWAGFLPDELARLSEYTDDVAEAVNRLKRDADLPENGTMTFGAWKALWDTDVVGYDTQGARIFPLARDTKTQYYRYSSTGAIIGRNDNWVPGTIRVDRTIDFGVCDEKTAAAYARRLIRDVAGHQWAGTITLNNIGVFAGERDNAYGATGGDAADILPAKAIRPGMNAWLPQFDGGTLVHIAGVQVSGTTVTLTVSTDGLDIFDITEALKRSQDTKRNIFREWRISNRGLKTPGNYVTHDKLFGKTGQDIDLTGFQWNVVQVVAGQQGTVQRSFLRLDADTEFYYAVFAKNVTGAGLDALVGDPSVLDGDDLTVWDKASLKTFFEDQLLLFVKGRPDQPCGYGWKKGYFSDGSRTANPLDGTDIDASSWSYITDPEGDPVLYLAIWPEANCKLEAGRQFWVLEDDVT